MAVLDGPVFPSVSLLKGASDAVVLGRVGALIASELDDPDKNPQAPPGSPVNIYQFTVERSATGNLRKGDVINVLYIDTEKQPTEGVTPLLPGQSLVLFLHASPNGTPGIESVKSYYYPRGSGQGVFDVSGADARARSPIVKSLSSDAKREAKKSGGLLNATVNQLLDQRAETKPPAPR